MILNKSEHIIIFYFKLSNYNNYNINRFVHVSSYYLPVKPV